jgi:16S rRNA (guanine527-N7)-methyltransferase
MNGMNSAMPEMPDLQQVLRDLDCEVDRRALGQLDIFRTLLLEYNAHTNLTAIRDPRDVEIKLFADSLALLPLLDAELLREGRETMRMIDIGTGAGFPGMPIAIARQNFQVTLVDATRKKVDFIRDAANALGLPNVVPIHRRSEELAHDADFRERFDVVTARAVASLPALIELCLPFLRVGGIALFTKGRDVEQEVASADKALQLVGGDLFDIWIPATEVLNNTTVISIRKFKSTPPPYPRATGIPAKTPLTA